MKCSNPTCTHKAHQGRKKCFQCLVSNAKYMRGYREKRKGWYGLATIAANALGQQAVMDVSGELGQCKGIRIPVSAPPAGKSLGVSGSTAAQP